MPYQRLQKGQKLKIPSRLQLRSTVFVNDFTPQKWLYLSIEFNQTVKNKYTSLVVRAPVFVLIGPIRASQKGPKLKILLRLQFHIMVSVNEFTPHKWLSLSIEFTQTVKNKSTSLVVRAPVFVLIGPIRASKRDQN